MKILFVDKQEILIDGITNLLAKSAKEIVEKANSIDDALNYFSQAEFDIIITDFNLVDNHGLDLIRKIKKIYPKLKIIILSMHDEAHLAKQILKDGIDGYVVDKDSHYDISEALKAIDSEKVLLSDDINEILSQSISQNKKSKLLTFREIEVLKLISNNCTTQEIAKELGLTEKTVESHRKKIFKKTKTSSVIGLLKYSYANNLL